MSQQVTAFLTLTQAAGRQRHLTPVKRCELDNTPAVTERRANANISILQSHPAETFRVRPIKRFVFAASDMEEFIFTRTKRNNGARPVAGYRGSVQSVATSRLMEGGKLS